MVSTSTKIFLLPANVPGDFALTITATAYHLSKNRISQSFSDWLGGSVLYDFLLSATATPTNQGRFAVSRHLQQQFAATRTQYLDLFHGSSVRLYITIVFIVP
jgi:hypothetical protein